MQDWTNDDQGAGRPAAVFGRRVTPDGVAPARPATPAEPPLATAPQRPSSHPPMPLPLSSQQLQLFTGPMGARRQPPLDPRIKAPPAFAPPPAAFDPPPPMPPSVAGPSRMRGGGRKIMAAVIGAVLGVAGGIIVVEAGRMVGAAQRVTPMPPDAKNTATSSCTSPPSATA